MDNWQKQSLIITASIILGLIIVLSGLTNIIHDFTANSLKSIPFIEKYAKENTDLIAESLAYTLEIIIAALILLSPVSAVSGIWYMRIAYELSFGINKNVNIFIISPILNYVMAFLCVLLFFYSLYLQYNWSVKLTKPMPKLPKDKVDRFI